jgi:oligopeptide/dipeptide ABC transporter ATP-binding protein
MPDRVTAAPGLLEISGLGIQLSVEGGTRQIVRDVSFSVAPGEALALVGESGAGKSLTARAIARLLPTGAEVSGQVLFDGASVLDFDRAALRDYRTSGVGIIAQDARAAINPVRRIGDFLTEALIDNLGQGPEEAEVQVGRLLREAGIGDPERRMRQFPHELSGGILQRVMIASVIAMQPRLILADEPTTALDVTTQSEVMAILSEMRERYGLALLLITHDLDLAAAVCERTVVMYAGTLVERQASSALHTNPLHPYTAALVTSRPSLEGRSERLPVVSGQPQSAFEVGAGCPFAPRCAHSAERCWVEPVALRPFDAGETACLRADELRGDMWPEEPNREGVASGAESNS